MPRKDRPDPEQFPHFCPKCDLTFLSPSDLEQHMQGLHHRLSESDRAFLRSLRIQPWDED